MNRVASRVAPLVSSRWLAGLVAPGGKTAAQTATQQQQQARVRVLDASLFDEDPDGRQRFLQRHIPSAQFFDIAECSDHSSPYPRMLPSPRDFEEYMGGQLGVGQGTHVVVYDSHPMEDSVLSAPRVWWMLRYFGHDAVSVLNGGLPRWLQDGLQVTDEVDKVAPQIFKAQPRQELLRLYESVANNVKGGCKQEPLLDARGPKGFEKREGAAILLLGGPHDQPSSSNYNSRSHQGGDQRAT